MAFNVVARNQDDHVKNIAFLMDRPALVALARLRRELQLQPDGAWTAATR
jgi:serine/threonine-protein kinase HipA